MANSPAASARIRAIVTRLHDRGATVDEIMEQTKLGRDEIIAIETHRQPPRTARPPDHAQPTLI
jgi:hypothetical protein